MTHLLPFPGVVDEHETTPYYYVPTDGKNVTTLSYANGPRGLKAGEDRANPTNAETGEMLILC